MNLESPGWRYRLLSIPLYLFWLLHALKHGHKHGLKRYLRMRVSGFADDAEPRVWVHASSVGEVRAVTPLVHALMQRGEKILFTSFTATGLQEIRRAFADRVCAGVIPLDHYWPCRNFFRRHSIKLGLVMETELWPELLYQARRQGVRLVLINARLSQKSMGAGNFVRNLLSTTVGYFSLILARNASDQNNLLATGAGKEQVAVAGNLKFRPEAGQIQSRLIERDYLLLASSHADEELQFLTLRPASLSHYLLVLAPRHPDRSAAIQTQIEGLGLKFALRSRAQPIDHDTEVYLADTLGELKTLMAHARVVVMGGSFDDTGGHNLIEPASLGCAIITGPSDSNISEDIEMLGINQGVLQVGNMSACWEAIGELLEQPAQAGALGREAQSRLAQQPDIMQRYLAAIDPWL